MAYRPFYHSIVFCVLKNSPALASFGALDYIYLSGEYLDAILASTSLLTRFLQLALAALGVTDVFIVTRTYAQIRSTYSLY